MKNLLTFGYPNVTMSTAKEWQDLNRKENTMEVREMTVKEQATILMDKFIDLQRIKAAADREKEISYQLKTTKAKLEALGIVTEDLNID